MKSAKVALGGSAVTTEIREATSEDADRLVTEAIALARANGCAEISVRTGLDNHPAQALYRSEGLVDESLLLERHFGGPA